MGKYYDDLDVKCPFYKGEKEREIICDGGMRNVSLHICYGLQRDFTSQKAYCCRKDYDKCTVYRVLLQKWEDENTNKI